MATASDGVIEAIERELCFGVEWHPETDPSGPRIYERFVELVGQDRARRDAG
jgi:gamma-glutamyl-gamma-aminobutyrate hydrolase PuuD